MAYLGRSPSQGVRNRYYFTASGGETSVSGALTGGTLTFTDGNYVDVNLNGVTLVAGTDYNTSTANTIAGLSALTANDVVEIVVYDVFSVFSGNVNSDFSVGGNLSVTGTATLTGAITSSAGATITTADNTDTLTLVSTDADANVGPVMLFKRDSSSPADNDFLGYTKYSGENDADEATIYAQTFAQIIDASDGTEDGSFSIGTIDAGTLTTHLVVDSSGVDITGTAVVDGLTCSGTTTIEGTSTFGTSSADTRFNFDGPNQYRAVFKSSGTIGGQIGAAGADDLRFSNAAGSTVASIKDGNLLVGKTSSSVGTAGSEVTPLYISATRADNSPLFLNRTNSDGSIITFRKDNSTVGSIGVNGSLLHIALREDGSNPVALAGSGSDTGAVVPATTSGAERDNAINLGKSTNRFKHGYFANTVYTASVAGITDNDTYINFANNNIMQFITGGAEKARVTSSSTPTILVGCTVNPSASAPGSMVSTTGAGSFTSFASVTTASTHAVFGNTNGAVGTIQTTNSTTAYNTSSDRRLKSNIEDAASASDKIDAIQVRQFDWNVDDSHQDYGLIAQELQPIEPLAVTGDADSDEMMGVDYSKLVPMLIKEIQELRGRVAALEAGE